MESRLFQYPANVGVLASGDLARAEWHIARANWPLAPKTTASSSIVLWPVQN